MNKYQVEIDKLVKAAAAATDALQAQAFAEAAAVIAKIPMLSRPYA
jgi:hypothetical protein